MRIWAASNRVKRRVGWVSVFIGDFQLCLVETGMRQDFMSYGKTEMTRLKKGITIIDDTFFGKVVRLVFSSRS